MRIPLRSGAEYQTNMSRPFAGYTASWVSLDTFLSSLSPSILNRYATVDVRAMSALPDDIQRLKRAMPTPWMADYFFWNVGSGTHHGIDIMMPQSTPILSLTEGIVTRVRKRDGIAKNDGNSVVIKTATCYRSYCHLDTITIKQGETVSVGKQLGTCGSTGMSTQFHLHLQCDTLTSPFQPYYTQDMALIARHTQDPLILLRDLSQKGGTSASTGGFQGFVDLPSSPREKQAFLWLINNGIVKGSGGKVFPNDSLQRYEFALLISRASQKRGRHASRVPDFGVAAFVDMIDYPQEVRDAIVFLAQYGIINGKDGNFFPAKKISGEEVLAVIGRLIRKQKDSPTDPRYASYMKEAIRRGIITPSRQWINKAISRQEMAAILYASIPKV